MVTTFVRLDDTVRLGQLWRFWDGLNDAGVAGVRHKTLAELSEAVGQSGSRVDRASNL